jgi:hypothetical protein
MFRDNEASRVSAVLERKLAGDPAGMIDAAVELWLSEPEQSPDAAEDEVWRAIVDAKACEAAATAGMRLIRDRQRVRPSAFVDIGEAVEDPATLVELAELVLDSEWDVNPYLVASFVRLVERGEDQALWELIRKRRDKLASTTEHWVLVAVILTTSHIGDRKDVASWFASWTGHDRVPMWILATYCATLHRLGKHDVEIVETAQSAIERAEQDSTVGYFAAVLAIDDLRHERYDAFRSRVAEHRAAIEASAAASPLSYPIVHYLQSAKHSHRVTAADLTFERPQIFERHPASHPMRSIIQAWLHQLQHEPLRPANWRTGELLNEISDRADAAKRVIDGFARVVDLSTGDPEIDRIARNIVEAECDLPGIQDAVNHVVRGLRRGKL